VDQAMAILADVVLNPTFDQKELDLLKSQTLDELTYNLKQPSFLANYVASKYTFSEHPAGGTPDSIKGIDRGDIVAYHNEYFRPDSAVLIFTGDITTAKAADLSQTAFGTWKDSPGMRIPKRIENLPGTRDGIRQNILVIDLPKSGQAAVVYAEPLRTGRKSNAYYPAIVLNAVLGGGYSSRLNYEIRIKRGLSYGAGSSFAWRPSSSDFSTRTQTKNESAAEVVGLVLDEVKKLGETSVSNQELVPRKSVLTGNFGRNLETTSGLATAVGELYSFGIPTSELNAYVTSVNGVNDSQIRTFATANLMLGDIIVVGDYSVFKDDLTKRFPNASINVIKADDLDLSKDNLRK
jgi:zinc protease